MSSLSPRKIKTRHLQAQEGFVCTVCGALHSNRVAADDNPARLLALAARPLAELSFPLEKLEEMLKETEKNG